MMSLKINIVKREHYRDVLPLYKELIRIAKTNGIVRVEIDPDVLVAYTLMIRKGAKEHPPPPNLGVKEYHLQMMELYLYGIIDRN
jgi:hypothetical protein